MSDPMPFPATDADLSVVITRANPVVLRAPCPVPVQTAFGTMHDRPALLIELEDGDGNRGLGEVWCNFPACGAEHRARLLETAILPAVLGVAFDSPQHCFSALESGFSRLAIQSGEPGPVAQCLAGIDVALWDLVARRAGLPLFRLLGGGAGTIPAYASGINPAGAMQTVERCRARGYRAFKLKIGFDRRRDLDNVARISTSLAPHETLMVDANQAWTLPEATRAARDLADYRLGWLEEPIMADSPAADWSALAAASSIPLAAGENIRTAAGFDDAIAGGCFGVIQPDLCKWGGISGVFPVARRAIAAGRVYCPHYLGAGVGLAASAHLLAAVGGDGLLEIDANDNPLRSDIFPAAVTDGMLALGEGRGLGVASGYEVVMASGRYRNGRA